MSGEWVQNILIMMELSSFDSKLKSLKQCHIQIKANNIGSGTTVGPVT